MNTIELTITKEDLLTALYSSNHDCPIARALIRAGMKDVACGGWDVTFKKPYFLGFGKTYRYIDVTELTNKIVPMMDVIFMKRQKEPETFTYTLKY